MARNKQSSAWKPTSPPSSLSGVWWFLIAELQPWRRWFSGNLSTFVSNRLIMVKCQVSICSLLAHCRQQLFKVINSLVKCTMTEYKEGATISVIGGIRNQCNTPRSNWQKLCFQQEPLVIAHCSCAVVTSLVSWTNKRRAWKCVQTVSANRTVG